MANKVEKTNVMRVLDKAEIPYQTHFYSPDTGIDAVSVAKALGQDPQAVFKTLVTQGKSRAFYVFVIPATGSLNLKRAAAACGGDVLLRQADCRHLSTVTTALQQAGCRLDCGEEDIRLRSKGRLAAVTPVRTAPYPGFPTDCQAILMAALLRSRGTTVFVENIFESRYRHVAEMQRMGADIRVEGRVAVVCGVERLHGADVFAADLRGGAALVIAALQAEGQSAIHRTHHIQRGYADLTGDLAGLGARILQQNE